MATRRKKEYLNKKYTDLARLTYFCEWGLIRVIDGVTQIYRANIDAINSKECIDFIDAHRVSLEALTSLRFKVNLIKISLGANISLFARNHVYIKKETKKGLDNSKQNKTES